MKHFLSYLFLILFLALTSGSVFSQVSDTTTHLNVDEMTKEQILELTYDQLLLLPLEDFAKISEKLGMTMDELLEMKIGVNNKPVPTRESPSLISIITEDEIKYSGARDIIDVLKQVPGFSFSYDIDGVIGVSTRGMWANEGKVLILVDGQEMNELALNTIQFGSRFNLNEIKRIEIIRGPGSAIYGGSAQLGVINIVTKQGSDINGFQVNTNYGQMERMTGRRSIDFLAGKKVNDLNLSLTGQIGDGTKSDAVMRNLWNPDSIVDLKHGSGAFNNSNLHATLLYKNWEVRYLLNNYNTHFPYDTNSFINRCQNQAGEIKYSKNITDKLSFMAKANEIYSFAYHSWGVDTNRTVNRLRATTTLKYDFSKKSYLMGGISFYNDHGWFNSVPYSIVPDSSTKRVVDLYNSIFFIEYHHAFRFFDLTIGTRTEFHNIYGLSYSPRIGITKVINKFHYKALFTKAFQTPSIGNLDFAPNLVPDDAYVLELELGYQLNENMFLTANVFNINKPNSITYWDSGDAWGYNNSGHTGSRGFEIDYRFRYQWGSLSTNYSFYDVGPNQNTIETFAVPDHPTYLLSAPKNKIAAQAYFNISKHLIVSPSVIFMSQRYFYNYYSADSSSYLDHLNPSLVVNLFVTLKDIGIKGLNIGAGVYDIFNQRQPYTQAYLGYATPFPAPSREIVVRLSYNFRFKDTE